MAVGKKFPDFQLVSELEDEDVLVGHNYAGTKEIRASIQTIATAIIQSPDHIVTSIVVPDLYPNAPTTLDTRLLDQYHSMKY